MSVALAHNVVGGFDLSAKEKRELAKMLISDASPKKADDLEWAKNDFKQRLKRIANGKNNMGDQS